MEHTAKEKAMAGIAAILARKQILIGYTDLSEIVDTVAYWQRLDRRLWRWIKSKFS